MFSGPHENRNSHTCGMPVPEYGGVSANGFIGRIYWPDENGLSMNETDLTGGTAIRNVYVGGMQIARQDENGNWWYPLHDQLGSTRMVLDATGNNVYDVDYYPHGTVAVSNGSTTNLYGFTGYETDTESATNYAVFRQQSPTLGRFMRPDPYDGSYDITNPQSFNRYSYVMNMSLSFTDPFGLAGNKWSDGCEYSYQVVGTSTTADGTTELQEGWVLDFCTDFPVGSSETTTGGSGAGGSAPSKIAAIARCASNAANSVSAASFLPPNAPQFFQNLLSNDVSSVSDLITGPGRGGAAVSLLQGKGLTLAGQAIGAIPFGTDKVILGQNSAGSYYFKDVIEGVVANTTIAKGLSKALGIVSGVKLGYDIGTYAEALYLCRFQ